MSTDQSPPEDEHRNEAKEVPAAPPTDEARLTEVANLVRHVRHEINNALTGVIGQAQLLQRGELSPKARQRVETIAQLAERIRTTVEELNGVRAPGQNAAGGNNDDMSSSGGGMLNR